MSTETQTKDQTAWLRVREAITEKWPHINRDELHDCENDTCDLTDFVKQRVAASDEEIESVVYEFAPQGSIASRVTHAANKSLHRAGESAQFAYMRADEFIAERPTESVVTSFIAGIILGASVTAVWCRSRPQPTTWDRIKQRGL